MAIVWLARALCVGVILHEGAASFATTPLRSPVSSSRLGTCRVAPLLNAAAAPGGKSDRAQRSNAAQKLLARMQRRTGGKPAPEWLRKGLRVLYRLRGLLPALLFVLYVVARRAAGGGAKVRTAELSFSAFMTLVAEQSPRISDVRISMSKVGFMLDGTPAFTRTPRASYDMVNFLHRSGVDFCAAPVSSLTGLLPLVFPILWLGALYSVMRKQLTGATGSVGKRASARLEPSELSFDDVAGVQDAKVEVQEIVGMLQDPTVYDKAGARLPTGVLMVGPPGTGKTLLARVMAAQAQVPFFYCSGSDFVELFIGRGAARMRALFKEAAESAPCIIFVDELDALGKQRAMRIQGNDEVEQTLNQMLACMDGLESNKGIVVMAATNRYEILDQALTRPGRFDRLVRISLPDEDGRLAILKVHTRKLRLEDDVQLRLVAAAARAFSGAELAALCNEAAIRAARRQSERINMQDFSSALMQYTTARRGQNIGEGLLNKFIGS